jgi:hypothetical protein
MLILRINKVLVSRSFDLESARAALKEIGSIERRFSPQTFSFEISSETPVFF